ncbi:MAG: glycosyltransferase family 4 protein [Magnetococcales bacterium]|nr:glycosyltransferase family 4 protein [Magnetococcales bacterium]
MIRSCRPVPLSDLRLTLFFTASLSLTEWDRLGMLERETALYLALRPHLGGISFVTYGDGRDLDYRSRLPGIDIACNRWKLSWPWYWRWLAGVPARWKSGQVIFKSNQMPGADTALALAQRFGKPCIARCGYLHSVAMTLRHGPDSPEARRALEREGQVFRGADRVVVTTPLMAETVTRLHQVPGDRLRVIPNYVDVERFAPASPEERPEGRMARVLFVGRLDAQKDPLLLVRALAGEKAELWLIGEGPLREDLAAEARELGVACRFFGVVPHAQLPEWMGQADLFVLPSPHEGHPKALLEAMACGMAVVGRNDAPGVREAIAHEQTGLLCDPTPAGMRSAIRRILDHPELKAALGRRARDQAAREFSLARIVEQELDLLRDLLADRQCFLQKKS